MELKCPKNETHDVFFREQQVIAVRTEILDCKGHLNEEPILEFWSVLDELKCLECDAQGIEVFAEVGDFYNLQKKEEGQ